MGNKKKRSLEMLKTKVKWWVNLILCVQKDYKPYYKLKSLNNDQLRLPNKLFVKLCYKKWHNKKNKNKKVLYQT